MPAPLREQGRSPSAEELRYMAESDRDAVRLARTLVDMSKAERVSWINHLLRTSRGDPLKRRHALLVRDLVRQMRSRRAAG